MQKIYGFFEDFYYDFEETGMFSQCRQCKPNLVIANKVKQIRLGLARYTAGLLR